MGGYPFFRAIETMTQKVKKKVNRPKIASEIASAKIPLPREVRRHGGVCPSTDYSFFRTHRMTVVERSEGFSIQRLSCS